MPPMLAQEDSVKLANSATDSFVLSHNKTLVVNENLGTSSDGKFNAILSPYFSMENMQNQNSTVLSLDLHCIHSTGSRILKCSFLNERMQHSYVLKGTKK